MTGRWQSRRRVECIEEFDAEQTMLKKRRIAEHFAKRSNLQRKTDKNYLNKLNSVYSLFHSLGRLGGAREDCSPQKFKWVLEHRKL
jgi:hypothetical protein